MLKWFNKQSSSSSKKQEESQQYSQLINSALTESDYEFLFNQLLDGVAHGWHLGKIIKFFSNLEPRSNVTQWIDWVEKFEKKISYSPDPSQKKVGAIMMRFGELTKPNDDLQKLGTLFYRIGNQLFVGRTTDLVWEYVGQDIANQESLQKTTTNTQSAESQEELTELEIESELELPKQDDSFIIDPDSEPELGLEADKSLENPETEQDQVVYTDLESPDIESLEIDTLNTDVSTQEHLNNSSLESDFISNGIPEDLTSQELSSPHESDPVHQEKLINEHHEQKLDESSLNETDLISEITKEDLAATTELETVEKSEQNSWEEFSPEEDLINKAFEENLAAQHNREQTTDTKNKDDALISNQAVEENLEIQVDPESTEVSFSSKFSPEEELINKAFEEGLAAQSKKSNSSSSQTLDKKQTTKNSTHNETQNQKVVLDLSLDLALEDLEGDREEIDHQTDTRDLHQEEFELSNSDTDTDKDQNNYQHSHSQQSKVSSTDLEVTSSKFSAGSFLEAAKALSNKQSVTNREVTVTWDEFVVSLEQDPVLAQNVAQQLGMVGVQNPQDIMQAAVNKFNTQKQAELSPANLELVKSWFQLGLKQASAKDFQGAITSWDQALNVNPNLSEAWHNKGSALGRLGKYIEAIQSFDHAVRIDPKSYQAWNDRAHALYKMQEWSKAILSWDRAIQIMPDRHQFWYNRGCALEQIKRFDESIASYEKALEIKPDFQPARSRHTVLIANNI